ncbi:hypothetical protein HDU96_001878 [Phlyctochytrium bullatum]|nr:hypothetical protein HDU96_001878 [Phlyctochytrium bullatum]
MDGLSTTTERAWGAILLGTENRARAHLALANSFSQSISERLKTLATKREEGRKKHLLFGQKLVVERDKFYVEKDRTKKDYDEACDQVESLKAKHDRTSDSKSKEKLKKAWQEETNDLHNAKNLYVLAIDMANAIKRKYYVNDLPQLLKDMQALAESTIQGLKNIWTSYADEEIQFLEACNRHTTSLATTIQMVDARCDADPRGPQFWFSLRQQLSETAAASATVTADEATKSPPPPVTTDDLVAVAPSLPSLPQPPDFVFVPSIMWREKAEMCRDDSSRVYLINRLKMLRRQLAALDKDIATRTRGVDGMKVLMEAYTKNPNQGDPFEVNENILEITRELTLLQSQRTKLETMIECIVSNVGESPPTVEATVGSLAVVLYEYKPPSDAPEDEIAVTEGETVSVIEVDDGSGWTKVLVGDRCGLVPTAYIQIKPAAAPPTPLNTLSPACIASTVSQLQAAATAASQNPASPAVTSKKPSEASIGQSDGAEATSPLAGSRYEEQSPPQWATMVVSSAQTNTASLGRKAKPIPPPMSAVDRDLVHPTAKEIAPSITIVSPLSAQNSASSLALDTGRRGDTQTILAKSAPAPSTTTLLLPIVPDDDFTARDSHVTLAEERPIAPSPIGGKSALEVDIFHECATDMEFEVPISVAASAALTRNNDPLVAKAPKPFLTENVTRVAVGNTLVKPSAPPAEPLWLEHKDGPICVKAKALFDYTEHGEDEISMKAGQELYILEEGKT